MTHEAGDRPGRPARLIHAFLVVAFLIGVLAVQVAVFHGTPHLPLVLGTAAACLVGSRLGWSWRSLEAGILRGIEHALQACLILLVVGCLIGTWIESGVVPTLIAYGLQVVSPGLFPFTACVLCSIVSLATGSSWSTAGTVGIALIGIGQGLGVPLPLVAGAIVSGAYLGDKMSPLSDTTNLAPAVAGTDLFTHVRHMTYTTGPSFALALIVYLALGLQYGHAEPNLASIEAIRSALESRFVIHPVLLIPPVLVIAMVAFRWPALPALLGGVVVGGAFGLVVQRDGVAEVLAAAYSGFRSNTGHPGVDALLSRGGMEGMFSTLALILCALAFGGVMERTGMLQAIARSVLRIAHSTGRLVLATILTCLTMNVVAPDQYLSIVVPGRMYREAYRERGLHLKNLSRALEDAGTLSSPLVPWNTCGAFMAATLGVSPLAYLPFAFLNLFNPVVSVIYGFTGWTMHRPEGPPAEPAAPFSRDSRGEPESRG